MPTSTQKNPPQVQKRNHLSGGHYLHLSAHFNCVFPFNRLDRDWEIVILHIFFNNYVELFVFLVILNSFQILYLLSFFLCIYVCVTKLLFLSFMMMIMMYAMDILFWHSTDWQFLKLVFLSMSRSNVCFVLLFLSLSPFSSTLVCRFTWMATSWQMFCVLGI